MNLYLLNNNPSKWQPITDSATRHTGLNIRSITSTENIFPTDFVMPTHSQVVPKCQLIGNRIYNRLQRMRLMENLGLRLINWSSLDNFPEIFKTWNTNVVVYKSDYSAVGRYVDLIYKDHTLPNYADANKDIMMEFIPDHPQVLKVYFCHDTIVTSYMWNLPSLNHPYFKQIIHNAAQKCDLATLVEILPTDVEQATQIVMRFLKDKYMGFCSIDFMIWQGSWSISELNISGVGSNIISRINKNWSAYFSKGLASLAIDLHTNKPSLDFIGQAFAN